MVLEVFSCGIEVHCIVSGMIWYGVVWCGVAVLYRHGPVEYGWMGLVCQHVVLQFLLLIVCTVLCSWAHFAGMLIHTLVCMVP